MIRCSWPSTLLRPRLARLGLAIVLGALSLGSALALAGVAAWLITRAWQMPPVLDLTVAVVAVRALGISRGVLGYCERLASHDTALRAAGTARAQLYRALVDAPAEAVMRLHSGDLLSRMGASVDELSDVLVRAVLPIAVAAVLSAVAVGVDRGELAGGRADPRLLSADRRRGGAMVVRPGRGGHRRPRRCAPRRPRRGDDARTGTRRGTQSRRQARRGDRRSVSTTTGLGPRRGSGGGPPR